MKTEAWMLNIFTYLCGYSVVESLNFLFYNIVANIQIKFNSDFSWYFYTTQMF